MQWIIALILWTVATVVVAFTAGAILGGKEMDSAWRRDMGKSRRDIKEEKKLRKSA